VKEVSFCRVVPIGGGGCGGGDSGLLVVTAVAWVAVVVVVAAETAAILCTTPLIMISHDSLIPFCCFRFFLFPLLSTPS
jgi:hypothetical protein